MKTKTRHNHFVEFCLFFTLGVLFTCIALQRASFYWGVAFFVLGMVWFALSVYAYKEFKKERLEKKEEER